LAERIASGLIDVDEATPLFIPIADGLEAAHEKGIIHYEAREHQDRARWKAKDSGLRISESVR